MAEVQCDYCKGQGHIHRVFYGGARGGDGDYTCPKCNGSGVLAQPAPTAAAPTDGAVTGDDEFSADLEAWAVTESANVYTTDHPFDAVPTWTPVKATVPNAPASDEPLIIGKQVDEPLPRDFTMQISVMDENGNWIEKELTDSRASQAEIDNLRRERDALVHELDAAERERDELARELQAARTKQAEHSEIEDLLMERGELTPGVSLSKQVADLLSKLETRRDVLEAESDELQAAVNAAVAGVDTLAPLEALTRLLELRRRVNGGV